MLDVRKKGNYIKVDGMTFSLGNAKLSSRTLIWSIAPGKDYSCRQSCPGCYAMNLFRRYPGVKDCWIKNYETVRDNPDRIVTAIKAIIEAYGDYFDQVRVHTAGEFFSEEYAQAWNKAAEILQAAGKQVYSYTKNEDVLPFLGNINVVRSWVPGHGFNFGPAQSIERLARERNLPICPATQDHQGPIICGDNCRTCINEQFVLFIKH